MGRRRFRLRLKLSCVNIARVLSASASFASKSSSASIKYGDTTEFPSMTLQDCISCDHEDGNKIMVVVNSGFEAACALDWALSHAVQPQDTVLLLHLLKPSSQGTETEYGERLRLKSHQLLVDMKNKCQMKRPGVQVRVVKAEGEEQGKAIVEEANKQRVSLLVMGQRKRSLWCGLARRLWLWESKRSSTSASSAVADYCIQNASCMTIAVRRKNRKLGGYLITTKRHKNFWLLA